jgi:hypothetical protein
MSRWLPRTHAVSTPVAGVRSATGYCPGRQRAVDTGMAIDISLAKGAGHPAVRRAVVRAAIPEAADGQSGDRSGSLQLSLLFLKAARAPAATRRSPRNRPRRGAPG